MSSSSRANPDVLVIGAGVAGASAAAHLLTLLPGAGVQLVERSDWPRYKVCGCCMNAAAVDLLAFLGLADLHGRSVAVDAVNIHHGRVRALIETPGGRSIARRALDTALVDLALERGAVFRPHTTAHVLASSDERWTVRLTGGSAGELRPRLVIVADGLNGAALSTLTRFASSIVSDSWIGLGAVTTRVALAPRGQIAMHIARDGYAGVVNLPDDNIAIAAAVRPGYLRTHRSPSDAIRRILESCGVHTPLGEQVSFKGTAHLTRSRSLAAEPGLFVAGDAAGYVEPFTGEGMSWALASGIRAAELAAEVLHGTRDAVAAAAAWQSWNRDHLRKRQSFCRLTRRALHTSIAADVLIRLAASVAPIRRFLASNIDSPGPMVAGTST